MIRLDSPIWKKLSSAGNDVDRWLRELMEGKGDLRESIEVVAEDLSHQLSWYSATSYALPHLAALCPRLSKEDRVYLIAQMGAAIAAAISHCMAITQRRLVLNRSTNGLQNGFITHGR